MTTNKDRSTTEMVNEIHTWLLTEGIDRRNQHDFVDGYCCLLRQVGLPVDRFFCGAGVMHPLVGSRGWKWMDGHITDFSWSRIDVRRYFSERENQPFSKRDPPVAQLIMGAPFVRIKTTDEEIPEDVDWMKDENYTDLFGLASPGTGSGKLEGSFTWATKSAGGFTDDQIEVFKATLLSLAAAVRLHISQSSSKTLLMTYLGEDAGVRVHGGDITRGEGLTIRSVIWFSDIRGFTEMSGELSRAELIDLVNGVFEVTAEVIKQHKGQTLKFMGDGLMAIFSCGTRTFQRASFTADEKRSMDEYAAPLCRKARLAAAALQTRLAALKHEREAKGLRGASVGIGLHYGDVSYGNLGAPERLDFTVLGKHVNLASRTESLCSKLGAKVLCTSDFVALDSDVDAWTSRGEHKVKGVADPVHVYELSKYDEEEAE